jgi:D-serine deaminase-like pyridoxal phosphate-dependent protein
MNIDELYTPCLIVDKQKLMHNLERMLAQAERLGVILRPHVKTTKSVPIALLANGGCVGPITVSTLREAEYFADAGFKDIIYAVSMVPSKLERVKGLLDRDVDLKMVIDNVDVAMAISKYGSEMQRTFNIMIEIDVDMHRAGLSPDAPEVIEIARTLHDGAGTEIVGVLTHAGESYRCRTEGELIKAAEHERASIIKAAENIIKAGYPCPIISCGSTPTATFAKDLTGVTELRAGIYTFQDAFQAGVGSCTNNDIALSVLCTVISHKKNQNRIISDAGGMALSKDQSTRGTDFDYGYGIVCDIKGNIIDSLIVTGANQEHGLITTKDDAPLNFDVFPIGAQLRILPNHSCMTAAAYDQYNVIDGSLEVSETWQRCNGW